MTYDYTDMILEIRIEMHDGILTPGVLMQVLRSTESIDGVYHPVVDWYYNDQTTNEMLTKDNFDDKTDQKEKRELRKQYEIDKPKLETISVSEFLMEMETWNKLI